MTHFDRRQAIASEEIEAIGQQALQPRLATNVKSYFSLPKRLLDLCLAMLMAPVLVPLIVVLWLLVRSDGGPGFFGHNRVGRHGKHFNCYKLRSMVPDAEVRLQIYLAENSQAAAQWQRDYKLDDDPRITKLGQFLRRSSLDELPQLWNVLRGEMSLVGPRPVTAPELSMYGSRAGIYRSMRPGITGLWQVSGRNSVSYERRVDLDEEYFHRANLLLDLLIIAKTALAVLNRTGR
ncbi:MAG: sugar transferase [Cypionkella sp.]|uniref:sugar transferase n=1 Tax=Cypionkella sp. TaxID=2811411 RepID=UPI002AB8D9EA|nr:sugar transferase [Cypionkella sp.]MDZ4309646.1 sugar transferase [Cypionkella sp.]